MFRHVRTLAYAIVIGAATVAGAAAADTAAKPEYPAIFGSAAQLAKLGIMLRGYGHGEEPESLKNVCYYYGDGSNFISVSDTFLTHYKARGFSLNSLCLALQSPLAFDPETGKRLPSYQLANLDFLRAADPEMKKTAGMLGEGVLSDELPLAVPDCFKRGLPFHDCKFRFDVQTGKPLSQTQLKLIAAGRALFDRKMVEVKVNHAFTKECGCKALGQPNYGHFNTRAVCRAEHWPKCVASDPPSSALYAEGANLGQLPVDGSSQVLGRSGISQIDVSPSLPLGYGYQLYTDGAAGSGGGDPSVAEDDKHHVTEVNFSALESDLGLP